MILKMAWRNIWRRKRRTWILISAVTVALFGLFFFLSVTEGGVRQAVKNIIDSGTGHIQIHREGYLRDPEPKRFIFAPDSLMEKIPFSEIETMAKRVNLQGVIYSPQATSPVQSIGGDLEKEKRLTKFREFLIKGRFPEKENDILIGNELADVLDVDLQDKIVFNSADVDGEIRASAFRISGIFKSPSRDVNRYFVLMDIRAAAHMAGYTDAANEIVIRLHKDRDVPRVQEKIKARVSRELEVLSWGDIYPALKYQFDIFKEMMLLFGFIILLGATFGIVNVFLMSIYERMREFGVMRAVGLKPIKLSRLIFMEGLLIGVVSVWIGGVLCAALYVYLSLKGLNLSVFSRSLEIWGTGAVIYPYISLASVFELVLMVFVIIFLSVIVPARKASKIVITEALRYV
ncbi:MAG: FtsX-like permease family protein [Candidatus Aminicenantales bacterium]